MAVGGSATGGVHAAYIGIGGVAKKIKNIYIGIGGVAKKVKKAYIGVSGVARLWHSATVSPIEYHGAATALDAARTYISGGTVGNYAVFAGGNVSSSSVKNVDAYNSSLVHSTATDLNANTWLLRNASVGNYTLFGLGNQKRSYVDAYNNSLVHSIPSFNMSRSWGGASVCGTSYALFAGGYVSSTDYAKSNVDSYSTSLIYNPVTELTYPRREPCGHKNSSRAAMFVGGLSASGTYSWQVESYSTSLSRTTRTSLSVASLFVSAFPGANYVIFANAVTTNGTGKEVFAFNSSFSRLIPDELSYARGRYMAGGHIGNYALFMGGGSQDSIMQSVDCYNNSLVKVDVPKLRISRSGADCANAGNYMLLAGGANGLSSAPADLYDSVDVYKETE